MNIFLQKPTVAHLIKTFFIHIMEGGVHTGSTRHVGHFWPIVPAPGDCENGEFCGIKIGRGNRSTGRKPAPAPYCPPQIPLDQIRARTRATTMVSQRLTALIKTYLYLHIFWCLFYFASAFYLTKLSIIQTIQNWTISFVLLCLRIPDTGPYSQIPELRLLSQSLRTILILLSWRLRLSNSLFLSALPTKMHKILISYTRYTCPAYSILLDFMTIIIFDKEFTYRVLHRAAFL
jgi:hypothetical protein